ncbi:centrosomal protein 2 [Holotrichia oblita]|uniref:Centrosomal protein 2 n=1 Tax=Holotrichia oblita TaxID=644536 RepID=A0ACB9T9V7_HOLOL|nr:centrosomal protein 2 [Holotrichia oblita]
MSAEFSAKEQMLRNATADMNRMQQDLEAAIRARDMAYQENRRLQDDLAACVADNKRTKTDLDIARRQVDDLKRQLQHYVAEIKRTEDLISHKIMLLIWREKIESQETMIKGYEQQLSDLTSQIARMEIQIVQQTSTNEKLETELSSIKDLCVKLDKQKDTLMRQLDENEVSKTKIDRDIDKIRRHSAEIQCTLLKERESVENLERLLAASRTETSEQRLLNQELQKEIKIFKDKIKELESKLVTTNEQLDLYQEKALEYSQQNKQLRREVANERFYRAREDESKRYPSL